MLRRLGFVLFTAIFIHGGWGQYKNPTPRADRARNLGLPVEDELVRLSGLAMLISAAGLQLSATRRLSALVIASQMPVVTLIGHRFWELEPGPQRNTQTTHFFKNVSLFGACLVFAARDGDRILA